MSDSRETTFKSVEKDVSDFAAGKKNYNKISPLPKPDFSSIEKKESDFTYKQKGSYKKPKSNMPESPMKSPNHKFFTPVKLQMRNIFNAANTNTCRKLSFGLGQDIKMKDDDDESYTESFRTRSRGNSLFGKVEGFQGFKLNPNSSKESSDVANKTHNNFDYKQDIDVDMYNDQDVDINPNKEITNSKNSIFENFAIREASIELNNITQTPMSPSPKDNNYNCSFRTGREDIYEISSNMENSSSVSVSPNRSNSNFYNQFSSDIEMFDVIKKSKFDKEFEIIKPIEAGDFGIVYKCICKLDNKIYAVKKSKKHSSLSDYNQTNFLINDMKKISSNCFSIFCVNYKECWLEEESYQHSMTFSHLYITIEFCHFGDLLNYLELLEKKSFKFNDVFYWDLIFEMLCGVNYIHECGYIHLDIKPGNFLIDELGGIKLADFGLTRKISEIKNSEDVYEGDCSYLAPEFFEDDIRKHKGHNHITAKSDVFALGLSILEVLCKLELPTNGVLWKKIRSENFEIPEKFLQVSNIKINDKMIKLMNDLLTITPDNRPSIISILQNPFYEEINYRYQKLMKNEYTRYFNPIELNLIEKAEETQRISKRSNSYNLFN